MGSLGLVVGRELREAAGKRAMWIIVLLVLLGSTAAVVVPELVDDDGPDEVTVAVTGGDAAFEAELKRQATPLDVEITVDEVGDEAAVRAAVDAGDEGDAGGAEPADAGVIVSSSPVIVVPTNADAQLEALLRSTLTEQRTRASLTSAGLSDAQISTALEQAPITVEEADPDASDRQLVALVVTLALYLILVLLMTQVATGVAIEKSNRISEVLLAIVRPGSLLFGKVIGVALVGLTVIVAGVIPIAVKAVVGGDLPEGLGVGLAVSAVWLLPGLVLYLTLAGALGSLVERQEETGSAIMPITLLLVATYVVGFNSLESSLGGVLAVFPLTSPIIMPSRIAVDAASTTEVVASLVLLLATVVLVARLATVVYRRAIVRTGKRLKLTDVLRTG